MRRKSDRDIRKENRMVRIIGYICIFLGLALLISSLIPPAAYEDYVEKDIVIRKIYDFHSRGSLTDYIVSTEGHEYTVTGSYRRDELYKKVSEGAIVTIKYCKNKLLPFNYQLEELTVHGERIVTYDNDRPTTGMETVVLTVSTLFSFLFGVILLILDGYLLRRNRQIQAKRDQRIAKKYGNTPKP